jgi:hypothetical protein
VSRRTLAVVTDAKLQILGPIVRLDAVAMMDCFVTLHWPSKNFGHDEPMLEDDIA